MVLRSFGDRVEVFTVSVPLSPSLGRVQPLSGIKLVIRCSQQVILVLLIYYREDRATLISINIGNLSITIYEFIATEETGAEGRQGLGARPHHQGARPVPGSFVGPPPRACF